MRVRFLSGVLLVLVLTPLVACSEGERGCIARVLREDVTAKTASDAQTVVERMRAIKMAACPGDFREAYVAHVQAWDRKARIAVCKPADPDSLLSIVGRGLCSFARGLDDAAASAAIDASYQAVERTAARHRAELPQ